MTYWHNWMNAEFESLIQPVAVLRGRERLQNWKEFIARKLPKVQA